MKANSPVRIAVAGSIGQVHIKRILAELRAELHAIIDPSTKAQEQAAALGVPLLSRHRTCAAINQAGGRHHRLASTSTA